MAIVTISRGTMSGGEALALRLSDMLGWPVVSREVINEAAEKTGISQSLLTQQLQKSPRLFDKYASERRLYLNAIQDALIDRALKGDSIYHGYAGHLLLKGVPHVLKVRLIAPMDYRIRMVHEKKGLKADAALRYIHDVDKQRTQWTRFLYNVDWADPAIYDVVFNLLHLSLERIADVISQIVTSPDFAETEQSRKAVAEFHVACLIKNALFNNERTRGFDLEVEPSGDGRFRISGKILTRGMFMLGVHKSKQEISDVARSVPGVKGVEIDIAETTVPGK